jgi:hypothetical protein
MGGVTIDHLTHKRSMGSLMIPYLIAMMIFVFGSLANAQGVPNNLQAAIFYKVLAYDYNIQSQPGSDITIAVVIDGKTSGQKDAIEAGFKKIAGQKLGGKTVKIATINISNAGELDSMIASLGGDIIYVAEGSADSTIAKVIQIANQEKYATLCGSEQLTQKGLAIGLTVEDGKPRIVINLPASRSQGMKLSSKVLRLAKILQ